MSDYRLPPGTIVTATLFRPERGGSHIGALALFCVDGRVDAETIGSALIVQHPLLIAGLQDLLPPGPPVSLVLNFILPAGAQVTLVPSVDFWPIDSALRRDELVERIFARLASFVTGAFDNVRMQLASRAMHADANAPAPSTVQ